MDRRSFLKLLGSGALVAVVPLPFSESPLEHPDPAGGYVIPPAHVPFVRDLCARPSMHSLPVTITWRARA